MGQSSSTPNKMTPLERYDGQLPGDTTGQSSPNAQEEQAPPYESTYSPADQLEWNVWTSNEQNNTSPLPRNPFIYGGATPASTKPKTVVLFGETGVGKSSVVNLMAGAAVARTSANLEACTMHATEYSFSLPGGRSFRIYDTVGLDEPEMGVNTFFGAIEQAHRLITSLHNAGGIDLLLFCVRGGRITSTMQRNYRLFFEFLCAKKVPLAFVITHLEYEDVMETWWDNNEKIFQKYGMDSVAHACVTAVPPHVTKLAEKRTESQHALRDMLQNSLKKPNSPYVKDVRNWFASMVGQLRSFLMKSLSLKKKDLTNRLQARCELSRDHAKQLADMLVNCT